MPSAKRIYTKLYEILGIDQDAPQKDITKAFRLRALQVHPDKRPNDLNAKEDFQALQAAYDILKDPAKRSLYNATGAEDQEDRFVEAAEHYNSIFKNINEEDIDSFAATYKGSKSEEEDVIEFYRRFNGNLTKLFEYIPLSEPDEVERFIMLVERLIKENVLEASGHFQKSCKKLKEEAKKYKKKVERESKNLEQDRKEQKTDALVEALQANQRRRGNQASSFLESLEAKYAHPKKKPKFEILDENEKSSKKRASRSRV